MKVIKNPTQLQIDLYNKHGYKLGYVSIEHTIDYEEVRHELYGPASIKDIGHKLIIQRPIDFI